ncbi:MAG: GNAT family N-acetyltransferase [Pleomorphochaeta sp.]
MIRKCTEKDRTLLNDYLYQRKELNVFLISDIQNFGFNDINLEIFIDYDEKINTIYLKFFKNLCVVSYANIINLEFIKQMVEKYSIVGISGEKSLINLIELENFKVSNFYFAALDKLNIEVDSSGVSEINIDELKEYLEITNKVFNSQSSFESAKAELEKKSKHIFVYKENGKIISGVSSSAESKELAILMGVFTIEGYRRKGLAQKCVSSICDKLIREGKTVCLFYDNPNAAKLYEKLGFKFKEYYSSLKKIN